MTDSNSTTPAAAKAVPKHGDVIDALLNLRGAIHLAREAVYSEMSPPAGVNDKLEAAECVLCLAEAEWERINSMIDCCAVADAWPMELVDISPKLAAQIDTMNENPRLRELFEECVGLDDDQIKALKIMVAAFPTASPEVAHG